MTDLSALSGSSSPIDVSSMPADVRKDGQEGEKAYQAAMSFESLLVKQLTKTLANSSAFGAGQDGDSGDSGSPAAYRDMVADNMADSIARNGGIGIAESLYKSLRPETSK
jgi:Rod binding domain-containing protein